MNTTNTRPNTSHSTQKNQLIAHLCDLTDSELHELGIRRQAIPAFIDDLVSPASTSLSMPAPLKQKPLRKKVHTINPHRQQRRIELQPKD